MGLFEKRKEKLSKIKELLFPLPEFKIDSDGEKFAVLKSVEANLSAVLQDLRDGKNDEAVQSTVKYCMIITSKVREILNEPVKFDVDTKYLIVDFDEEKMREK